MTEDNKHLKDFLNALNSKYNIWILPMNEEAAEELMQELKEIVGEENWEAYLRKQGELNNLRKEE